MIEYFLEQVLKQEEGLSLKAYKCTANRWTIGYGHRTYKKLKEISLIKAELLLILDYNKAIAETKSLFPSVDYETACKLSLLCFQVGKKGLSEFKELAKIINHNSQDAESGFYIYKALKNSKLNKQAPKRTERLIEILTRG